MPSKHVSKVVVQMSFEPQIYIKFMTNVKDFKSELFKSLQQYQCYNLFTEFLTCTITEPLMYFYFIFLLKRKKKIIICYQTMFPQLPKNPNVTEEIDCKRLMRQSKYSEKKKERGSDKAHANTSVKYKHKEKRSHIYTYIHQLINTHMFGCICVYAN